MSKINWFEASQSQLEVLFRPHLFSEEQAADVGLRCMDAFHQLFEKLILENKFRDKWHSPLCDIGPHHRGTVERSVKMRAELRMGISTLGFYASFWLRNGDHLRHMADDFWSEVLLLGRCGVVVFDDCSRSLNRSSSEADQRLLRSKSSLVFSLARDAILAEQDGEVFSGGFDLTAPHEADEEYVRDFFSGAVRGFYKLNYLLFRSAYQKADKSTRDLMKRVAEYSSRHTQQS